MNIKSYLAQPHESRKEELFQAISLMPNCEVVSAENRDVLVVITETQSKIEEEELYGNLEAIDSLRLLTLVSGFNAEKTE